MLTEILRIMGTGTSYSTVQLADALKTTPECVQRSLDCLERLGYIRRISVEPPPSCSGSCKNCHCCEIQEASRQPVMWEMLMRNE